MWKQDVWYVTNQEKLESFMDTGSADNTIGTILIDVFGGVDNIRFKVSVNCNGDVDKLIVEDGRDFDELHRRLDKAGIRYWFDRGEYDYFFPETQRSLSKLEEVLNIKVLNVDGYIIKNIQEWDSYLDQVIRNSKQEAANKKRQEIKQLKAELEAAEKELAELVK
ncbi:hypothetical protein JK32_00059 [Shigella phage JK32]|nr:hypothetical protein JK32_00059 [Shigella phage JK32]